MATLNYTGAAMTLTGPTLLVLGNAAGDAVSSWVVGIRPTAATFTMTARARMAAAGVDPVATDPALTTTDLTTGVTSTGSVTGATSSTNLLLRITADALSVALDFSTLSAGSLTVVATAVRG